MAIELKTQTTPSKTLDVAALLGELSLLGRKVTDTDRQFFTERLALLLQTGSSLHASLELLAEQVENPRLGTVIRRLREDVGGGLSFSQALANHPHIFSTTYINLVAASEQGGFMAEVLQELIEMEERRARLKATIKSAMFYPAFLAVFSLCVVIFVLTVVFPKFAGLFTSIADQLPASTLVLMATSDFLRHYWAALTMGLAGGFAGLAYWLRQPSGSELLDRLKLRTPLVKDIFLQLYLSQVMRVMGLSLKNGVSVLDALSACRDLVRNRMFRKFMDEVEAEVNAGQGIGSGFQRGDFLPPLAKHMVTTGEDTGSLPLVMTRVADFYERELTSRLNNLSKIAEPTMLLVMGVVVGLLVSSLILPIFKLSQAVH